MTLTKLILALCCLTIFSAKAQQTISAKIIDSTKHEPIPFVTISIDDKTGTISNDKGEFNLTINRPISTSDSLYISCMGYEQKTFAIQNFTESTITLNAKNIDLSEVFITNKNYTLDEILDKVKEGLKINYDFGYAKRKLFYRESYYTQMLKTDVKIEKTTIPEFNQAFVDSIITSVPKNTDQHTEVLGELYGQVKASQPQKMEILKASRLYDKQTEITLENYEKRFNEIIRKHVKRDSYFKIKSGWFGTKEEIDSTFFGDNQEQKETAEFIEKKKEQEAKRQENFLKWKKSTAHNLENANFLNEDSDLNFIKKSRRYEFEMLDFVYFNNEFVYTISFKPKRSADFEGTLYINTQDFAIVRVDYKNVKPLRKFGLLGISMKEYLKEGTIIFQKNAKDKYTLKYADETNGQQVGIKRPLKIIEKNKNVKGRRKQNELAADIHFIVRNIDKKELIIFESTPISETEFNDFTEVADVIPTYLPAYDPEFWKGYNIIEPNTAIKNFKIIETSN
ncbi:carboxypeptidase-like regulatory domain-containing protein [Bizionia argentinensis JUB59]|uniref:Carboxypeptidase-like regulatory domain-containing protein n=1 Tax=Bizionia argentinensis JUB59 TaxID=1046627 RepID=G2EDS5_9FLAO|nr:carboxypeptidase-like regulatory domain-containing protein [Bizionia argentinensis]EGV43370.1 carboxypeptidase-like regulatory domain-containing protein [Bizionia argentinensis JUB59]